MLRLRSWLHSLVARVVPPSLRRQRGREKPSRLLVEQLEIRQLLDGAGADPARLLANFSQLPLPFEANQGQAAPQVKFLARGSGYGLFLTSDAAVLSLVQPATAGATTADGPAAQPPLVAVVRMQ